tara:strand:- start:196 stop:867 length:672 start_codon:yes stop_codon:yes gene_type:complete
MKIKNNALFLRFLHIFVPLIINKLKMKKIILLLSVVFLSTSALQAQDSKFYLGVGAGYASAGGDLSDGYKGGIHINFLNMGYRFNESWGVTANLGSAGHSIDADADVAVGIGAFSVGPMYSMPVGSASWDFKPQYAFSMKGVVRGDDAANSPFGNLEDLEQSGSGFILGNSFVFGDGGKGFSWSIDVDYLMGNFDEVSGPGGTAEVDEDYSSLRLGVGVRYNF